MFQSLAQIQRLSYKIDQLEKQKNTLQSAYYESMGDEKVGQELSQSIRDIISKAKKQLQFCETLQKEIQSDRFVPSQFAVESLVYDVKQLPQWFTFVFKKEFDKQRSGFSAMAKKLYNQHGLSERKRELENEINSFQNLNQRYEALNKSERGCLNIDLEGETFQNKVQMLIVKFVNFIVLVGQRIQEFVEENAMRSLNYTSNINNFANNPNGLRNPEPSYEPGQIYQEKQAYREARSIEKSNFRSTAFTMPSHGIQCQSRRQMARATSSNKCLNHAHHDHFHNTRPVLTAFDGSSSRFNYRDHAPKWMMANSLANFYF